MQRRTATAVAFAALVPFGGCLGVLTGSERLSFEASPAAVSEAALDEAGYESTGTETRTDDRTVGVLGQDRTVTVTSHVATYERRAPLGPLGERTVGTFVAVSTPAVELAGEARNPVGGMDGAEVVRRFGRSYGEIDNVSGVGSRTVTALNSEATVEKYAAEATVDGERVPVFVHVATIRDGEDFVVAVGAYPRSVDGEAATLGLIRGLRHPV